MNGHSRGAAVCGLAALAMAPGPALAAGFAIKEQSATAQGNAFAGATAEAADISYMFFNPAGLTRHSGNRVSAGLNYIAPQSEPQGMTGAAVQPGVDPNGGDDAAVNALAPMLYGMLSLSEDLKLGLGVNAPFGLSTEYDRGWAGRYHALDSDLTTINVNPTVAYRVRDWLSIGAGLQIQYADAELSNAVDFGAIGAAQGIPGAAPGTADGLGEVSGDDIGFGGTLGVLIEPSDTTRIGLSYRSQVAHELEGDADFSGGGAVRQALAGGGAFTDTSVQADLTTPDQASIGVYQEITPQWAVMGELQWTDWSDFDSLRIQFDDSTPDSVTEEAWNDTMFVAVGATYRPRDDLALRLGVAYDESPIPDATRTPRIPGSDRTWLSLGAEWTPMSFLTLNAAYTHIFVKDSTVSLDRSDPGNAARGDLDGRYENSIDLVSVQATLRF